MFQKWSKITETNDNMSIVTESFEFTEIKTVEEMPAWRSIDIIGVVAEVGPCENKNLKSGVTKK